MAHKHGKKRTQKEQKPSPAEQQRISNVEALRRVHEVLCVIMCNTCEKKETCTVRMGCILYSDEIPKCPSCSQTMKKENNIFICPQCTLEILKEEEDGGIEVRIITRAKISGSLAIIFTFLTAICLFDSSPQRWQAGCITLAMASLWWMWTAYFLTIIRIINHPEELERIKEEELK